MRRAPASVWLLPLVALAAACKDDSSPLNVVPLEPSASTAAVGGGAQTATVNAFVAADPSVLVTDRYGNPVPDVEVVFEVTAGGGTVQPGAVTTDASGTATTRWRLGTTAGENGLRAVAAGLDTVTFSATGTPDDPAIVVAIAGDHQSATVTRTLPDTLVAESRDRYDNVTPGVSITWTVSDTSARVTAVDAETDDAGRARAVWTLGRSAGQKQLDVRTGGAGIGSFSATAAADAPASMGKVSGDAQTGAAGAALPEPLTARLLDQYGNGVPDTPVVWEVLEGDGSFDPVTTLTDAQGDARGRYVAGRTPQVTERVRATFGALAPVEFTAETSDPDNLVIDGMYLTQAAQNYAGSVPLVAGRDGLLRVFVRAGGPNAHRARVAVNVYNGATLVSTDTLVRDDDAVPTTTDRSELQSALTNSWNLFVPAALIQPGLAIVADADPGDLVYEADEGDNVFPAGGGGQLDVRVLPDFHVRLVPIQIFGTVGETVGDATEANKVSWLTPAFAKFPIPAYDVDVRQAYTSGVTDLREPEQWEDLLQEIDALRVAEGTSRYYYGVIAFAQPGPFCGIGYVPGRAGMGKDGQCGAETAAHEWGHNFGRRHAPCGNPAGVDPNYPYPGASIGVWGLNVAQSALRSPNDFADLMSYCDPPWVSDYTYAGVLNYRDNEGAAFPLAAAGAARARPALVVWGRIEDDRLVLEPSFGSTTVPSLPAEPGPYTLDGLADDGSPLFSLSFAGTPVADLDHDARHFAFAVPMDGIAAGALARIRLAAPGTGLAPVEVTRGAAPADEVAISVAPEAAGLTRLRWDAAAYPLAVVRSAATGQILSLARGSSTLVQTSADELEVMLSAGVGGVVRRVRVR